MTHESCPLPSHAVLTAHGRVYHGPRARSVSTWLYALAMHASFGQLITVVNNSHLPQSRRIGVYLG